MQYRRPLDHESVEYYKTYIRKVEGNNFIQALKQSLAKYLSVLQTLTKEQWNFRYAPDKWTVKEVLIHVMDTERIFAYRALRIARNDRTPLPGFEQNDYIPVADAENRSVSSLLEEYELLRRSTVSLFQNMSDTMLDRIGTASGGSFSVLALGFMIAGHEIHHWEVLQTKYGISWR